MRILFIYGRRTKLQKNWIMVNSGVEEITRVKLPINPRVMLLLDFDYGGVTMLKELFTHVDNSNFVNSKILEIRRCDN